MFLLGGVFSFVLLFHFPIFFAPGIRGYGLGLSYWAPMGPIIISRLCIYICFWLDLSCVYGVM